MVNITNEVEEFSRLKYEKELETSYQIIVDSFVNTDYITKNEFFSNIFHSAFELIPEAEKGSFYELDKDKLYHPIFSKGYDTDLLKQLKFTEKDIFKGFEVTSVKYIDAFEHINFTRDDKEFSKKQIELFKSLGTYSNFTSLYAPINVNGINVGLLSLERFDGKGYKKTSKLILKLFAQLISNFYSQILQLEKEKDTYYQIIDAMVSAIEIKDKYTEGHARRVTTLSTELGKYMGLKKARIDVLGTAALLHDIGKIGIRTEILEKKGKLTTNEYELIKLHPGFTEKILSNISDFSDVVDIAYMHHEFYNGNGYPQGLKGDEISIEASILQVVDAFDAMTSDRAYRKAMTIDQAIDILKKQKGQQFHPEVVDNFIKYLG